MSDCGHGWTNENDCEVCRPPAIVVAGLRGRISDLEAALRPFAEYAKKRDAMPLRGLDDSVHRIHTGTPHFAEITMEHCRAALEVLMEDP